MPENDLYLKPCPFCGGEAERAHLRKRWHSALGWYRPVYIRCKVCGATSPVKITVENAREAWNRRAEHGA